MSDDRTDFIASFDDDIEVVTHAVERTSPKGPGQTFIGRCVLCGATGLTMGAALVPCPNPGGVSNDDALIALIEGDVP